jgi:hypothetical protein
MPRTHHAFDQQRPLQRSPRGLKTNAKSDASQRGGVVPEEGEDATNLQTMAAKSKFIIQLRLVSFLTHRLSYHRDLVIE